MAGSSNLQKKFQSQQEKNGLKLRTLDEKTDISLLDIFHKHFSRTPSDLYQQLSNHKTKLDELKKKKILKLDQFELLFPTSKETHSNKFDATLTFLLIRTLCGYEKPSTGWDSEPKDDDVSEIAQAIRLKLLRNQSRHSRLSISTAEYKVLFNRRMKPLLALGHKKDDLLDLMPTFQYDVPKEKNDFIGREDEIAKIVNDFGVDQSNLLTNNQSNSATSNQSNAATNNQSNSATNNQSNTATNNQSNTATNNQSNAATSNQSNAATNNQSNAATNNQSNSATNNQLNTATNNQSNAATSNQSNTAPNNQSNAAINNQSNKYVNNQLNVVIAGIPGAGKSELANMFYHKHKSHYDHVIWVNMDNKDNTFSNIAKILQFRDRSNNKVIAHLLKDYFKGENLLCIFDNCTNIESLSHLLDISKHDIITTQIREWSRMMAVMTSLNFKHGPRR